jgi:transcriptional regulator with XRE-family HTH domain
MDNERLGRAVNVILAERRMGRKSLSDAASISYPYLSEFLRGQKMPTLKKLTDIASALNIELSDLLARAEQLPDLPEDSKWEL